MNKQTSNSVELAIAWTGPLCILGMIFFWGIMGHNIPPPNFAGMTAEQLVTDHYVKYQSSIAIGMAVTCIFGMLYLPWSCQLASMLRNEDGSMGVLSLMEYAGGILTAWVLAFCPAIWLACAIYATQLEPIVIKTIHSFTWYIYDMTFMITTVQLTGLGIFTVLDKQQTIFPQWSGWGALAVGVIFMPLVLIAFVTDGPFAVGGIWNFYIVFSTWLFLFFVPYSYFMIRELSRRRQDMRAVQASAYPS
jgi:hypothetical protein|tara:strand:+ start:66 stop:809 length:744 start_codon:yes stop_codon:yes gene_type:complete